MSIMHHKALSFGKLADCIAMLSWRKKDIAIHDKKKKTQIIMYFFNADLY